MKSWHTAGPLEKTPKIRENFVSDPQLIMIQWLWCNNGLSEKVLY